MSLFEAIKNMSLDEFLALLRLFGADADDLYCSSVCDHISGNCDYGIDNKLPCDGVDVLREVLNANFELFREYIEEECNV